MNSSVWLIFIQCIVYQLHYTVAASSKTGDQLSTERQAINTQLQQIKTEVENLKGLRSDEVDKIGRELKTLQSSLNSIPSALKLSSWRIGLTGVASTIGQFKSGEPSDIISGTLGIVGYLGPLILPPKVGIVAALAAPFVNAILGLVFKGNNKQTSMSVVISDILKRSNNELLMAEATGVKARYVDSQRFLDGFREANTSTISNDEVGILHSHIPIYSGVAVLAKLRARIQNCRNKTFKESAECVKIIMAYSELQIMRQYILMQMYALLLSNGNYPRIKNGYRHVINGVYKTDSEYLFFLVHFKIDYSNVLARYFFMKEHKYVIDKWLGIVYSCEEIEEKFRNFYKQFRYEQSVLYPSKNLNSVTEGVLLQIAKRSNSGLDSGTFLRRSRHDLDQISMIKPVDCLFCQYYDSHIMYELTNTGTQRFFFNPRRIMAARVESGRNGKHLVVLYKLPPSISLLLINEQNPEVALSTAVCGESCFYDEKHEMIRNMDHYWKIQYPDKIETMLSTDFVYPTPRANSASNRKASDVIMNILLGLHAVASFSKIAMF